MLESSWWGPLKSALGGMRKVGELLALTRGRHKYVCIYNIHVYIYVDILCTHRSIDLSIDRSIDLSIYLPTYLSTYLSIYLPTYLSIYLSIYLSTYLSICLSIYLSIYLSIFITPCCLVWMAIHFYSLSELTFDWSNFSSEPASQWVRHIPMSLRLLPLLNGMHIMYILYFSIYQVQPTISP